MKTIQSSRIRLVSFAIPLIAVCLGLAISASAGIDPGAKCATSKQKAAAKKLSEKVKCHGTAIKKGIAVDAACLTKAENKYEASFAKAEEKDGCVTTGDVDEIETLIDETLADMLEALPASAPTAEICDNIIDDDSDGFVDCDDADCTADPLCAIAETICDNGIDDDGDGFVDCFDTDCETDALCAP